MKTIKLSPKKLDAAADAFFANVKAFGEYSPRDGTPAIIERQELAGLALRRWAQQIRDDRKAERERKKSEYLHVQRWGHCPSRNQGAED